MREMPTAGLEQARWPGVAGAPHPTLRPLERDYAGSFEATEPSRLVLPAPASVPLILKIRDSAYRPPQFVTGVHGSHLALDGTCSPSYLEVGAAQRLCAVGPADGGPRGAQSST
jgi:hypothetical protein